MKKMKLEHRSYRVRKKERKITAKNYLWARSAEMKNVGFRTNQKQTKKFIFVKIAFACAEGKNKQQKLG